MLGRATAISERGRKLDGVDGLCGVRCFRPNGTILQFGDMSGWCSVDVEKFPGTQKPGKNVGRPPGRHDLKSRIPRFGKLKGSSSTEKPIVIRSENQQHRDRFGGMSLLCRCTAVCILRRAQRIETRCDSLHASNHRISHLYPRPQAQIGVCYTQSTGQALTNGAWCFADIGSPAV